MSYLARQLVPYLLEDDFAFRPLAYPSDLRHTHGQNNRGDSRASAPFGDLSGVGRVAQVELKEEPNHYYVEAELPGVKKHDLDVHVGDNGRSITIEGKVMARSSSIDEQPNAEAQSSEVARMQEGSERWEARSSFSRTIWLPRAVDANKVNAKLEDGILRLTVPKLHAHKERHKVTVE